MARTYGTLLSKSIGPKRKPSSAAPVSGIIPPSRAHTQAHRPENSAASVLPPTAPPPSRAPNSSSACPSESDSSNSHRIDKTSQHNPPVPQHAKVVGSLTEEESYY